MFLAFLYANIKIFSMIMALYGGQLYKKYQALTFVQQDYIVNFPAKTVKDIPRVVTLINTFHKANQIKENALKASAGIPKPQQNELFDQYIYRKDFDEFEQKVFEPINLLIDAYNAKNNYPSKEDLTKAIIE